MSFAFTPGLKVTRSTIIKKERMLPVPGEVLVREGDVVSYDTEVARTYIPGNVTMMPAAYAVGVEPYELPKVMLKKEGESVEEGEIIARSTGFFGLFKKEYGSKVAGTIELISDVTGMIAIREQPVPIHMDSYISGKVAEVIPGIGAVIETNAAFVQGIFGIGGEKHGELMTVTTPDEILKAESIREDFADKILVCGSLVTSRALKKAEKEGVRGIITGGIDRDELTDYLGYEMGVAITGNEEIGLTCIITEGFGEMRMAGHIYHLLDSHNGKLASINGATQIRAGVIRPEIIVPLQDTIKLETEEALTYGMEIGTRVRVIRQPYFGALGSVAELPIELQTVETESHVRVLRVALDDGRLVTVPRANVEIME